MHRQTTQERQRLLYAANSRRYAGRETSPPETVALHEDLVRYLQRGDPQLGEEQRLALEEMLFYLCVLLGQDVAAQGVFQRLRDTLGDDSCRMQVMKTTLLQVDAADGDAVEYLEGVVAREHEYDTDSVSYVTLCKKLLAMQIHARDNEKKKKKKMSTEQVVHAVNSLIEKCPLDPELWSFLATVYQQQGEWDTAAYCLEEVVLLMPFNHVAMAGLSEVLYYRALQQQQQQHKDSNGLQTLQQSLDYALRAVELSELYLKGWAMVRTLCQAIPGKSDSPLAALAHAKLQQIQQHSNDSDKRIAKHVLN